ncbi:Fe2+-dependent dioxygenase [Ectopseudomonas alcaliphila]|uniref:Fe2+-dependent dioxygenase n=1 Tax=Ectopseudomonas alcaliphila TaxID=101564 RepID=UPI00278ACF71|nr:MULTISPECIES: Fe2+-dependent dioxygenase [Pseudomonas]MDP9938206.1 PKHD-type hydroxylase [Pseudomonas sp. 3400]MDR7010429.1 PKHD-type hydroxylase [Pseudomonas alcaliphila]
MLLHIPQVLTQQEVADLRAELAAHDWVDGGRSSGAQAAALKRNQQFPVESPAFAGLSQTIAGALQRHPLFVSAVLPRHMLSPMFNCYSGGGRYGNHVDNALQRDRFSGQQARTDVSTTVFLSEPDEYEGGELIIEDTYGEHEVKLAAGDAIVYPATSLHRVEPVTSGTRIASFLWTQSWVRDAWQRKLLFELDMNILKLRAQLGDSEEVLGLTSTYHNLLRQWSE